jgi:hypothetical protein
LIPVPFVLSDSAEPFGPEFTAEGLVAGRRGREKAVFFLKALKISKIEPLWWKK